MKRMGIYLVLVTVLAFVGHVASAKAQRIPVQVEVMNAPTNTVPVEGQVEVTNIPKVEVTNTPLRVVNDYTYHRTPGMYTGFCIIEEDEFACTHSLFLSGGAERYLVIETISVHCRVDFLGEKVDEEDRIEYVTIEVEYGDRKPDIYVPLFKQGKGKWLGTQHPSVSYAGTQQVRIYADPETQVNFLASRFSKIGRAEFRYTLSGYWLDINSRSIAP